MNTQEITRIATHLAAKAELLAREAKALAILAEEPGPARLAMERIVESEQGICWVVDALNKAFAK